MDYVSDGRRSGRNRATTIEFTELRPDHLNARKFYRVERNTLTPFKLELSRKKAVDCPWPSFVHA